MPNSSARMKTSPAGMKTAPAVMEASADRDPDRSTQQSGGDCAAISRWMARHRSVPLAGIMLTRAANRPSLFMSILNRLFAALLFRMSVRWFVMLKSVRGLVVLNYHGRFAMVRRFKMS